jgi:hypothetical protein
MSAPVFRFDSNLEHQTDAVSAVCDLFDGLVSDRPDFSFEGVVKTHEQTAEHFASLYGNERPLLIQYDGGRVSS